MLIFNGAFSCEVCYHCVMWMNYSIETRDSVDGVFGGWTIVEYVMNCKNSHDKNNCIRNSINGGCFICDFLNEKSIEGIKNKEILNDKLAKNDSLGDKNNDGDNGGDNNIDNSSSSDDYYFEITI